MALTQHKDAQQPSKYHLFLKKAGTQRCWRAENENILFEYFQEEQMDDQDSFKCAAACRYFQDQYTLTLVKDFYVQLIPLVSMK